MATITTSTNPNYNPLAMLKTRTDDAGDAGEKKPPKPKPVAPRKDLPDQSSQWEQQQREVEAKVDETLPGVGKRMDNGTISFFDDGENANAGRKVYHSSDDEDGPRTSVPIIPRKKSLFEKKASTASMQKKASTVPVQKKPNREVKKRRYYSSSSDEEDNDKKSNAPSGNFMSKLESFNSGFWKDSDDEDAPEMISVDKGQSDAKRRQSMKDRQAQLRKERQNLKQSLAGIDGKTNKKIKFDQEEGKEDEAVKTEKKGRLFDDSDEEDDEDAFGVRPQFEGKSGQKLLSLQSRFANDQRFKIDERFKEKGAEPEVEESKQEPEELEEERKRNLAILDNLMGKSQTSVKKVCCDIHPATMYMFVVTCTVYHF